MVRTGETLCVLCGAIIPAGSEQCPRCGTRPVDVASAKTSIEAVARASTSDMLRGDIPRTNIPEMKDTCPFCAQEIPAGLTRCTRCGVPLKDLGETVEPIPDRPSQVSARTAIPSSAVVSEGQDISSSPGKLTPSPMPAEPPKRLGRPPELTVVAPAESRRTSSGLVNGRGATNGTSLVNGRGAINGTGLVNGTGMVNGTRRIDSSGATPGDNRSFMKRWQFLAILVAIAIVLPTFIYLSYSRPSAPGVDGDFGEWAHITKFGMQAPASLPEVTVEEWALRIDADLLNLYLQTGSNVMGTSNVDSFFLFVDSDGDSETGYSVSGIGANYMLELHGWDQKVESASLMRFDSSYDPLNWTSWTSIGSLTVATRSDKLEAQASLPLELDSDARFMLLAQNNLLDRSISMSFPVPAQGGVLIIIQEPGASVNTQLGVVPTSTNISLARLTLKCEGTSGIVSGISPVIDRAGSASPISEIALSPGESKTVDVFAVTSGTSSQSLVSAWVTEDGVTSTFSDVVIIGQPVRAYVSSPPPSIEIDGAFADWIGRTVSDADSEPMANPNVDIAGTGAVNTTSYAAFYVGVHGDIFRGECVPATRGKPTSQGGGGTIVPHRKTGEDILRIYIDSDMSNTTGQLIKRSIKEIGADYLIEVDGIDGKIVSQNLMKYSFGSWVPAQADVAAMAGAQQIEASVLSSAIGGNSSLVAIIETTDWRSRSDWAWAGGIPDPWVVDSSGNAYQSDTGAIWNYLGTPTLEPGDRVVDVIKNTDDSIVYIVTNTGRTYFWTIGTSTSWEPGVTDPINTALYGEAVSMCLYSRTGAYLLAKNGSFFYVMKAGSSQKPWTHYGYANETNDPVTDFTDIFYSFDGQSMYALRSAPNSRLYFSSSGNSFTSNTSVTGSTSPQTDFVYIGTHTNTTDRIFVLCENGNIRYSSTGGQTWSALGNLPAPGMGNTSKYVGIGIDPSGYMWVVTDTGHTYSSTDTTTYNSFTYRGQAPITGIVAILPFAAIPEFPAVIVPVIAVMLLVTIPRIRHRRSDDA